jgi:hypothetical protein
MEQFGYNPFEVGDANIVSRAEEKEAQRQWQEEMKREGWQQAQILKSMGGGAAPKMPTAPGYETFINESGEYQMRPIKDGPADAKLGAAEEKKEGAAATKIRQANLLSEDIDRAVGMARDYKWIPNTGVGAWVSKIPGTRAHDLDQMLEGIGARISFDSLQEMRANSPTGAALGSISDQEGRSLRSTFGSLSQSQSEEEFVYNLERLKREYNALVHGPQGGVAIGSAKPRLVNPIGGGSKQAPPKVGEVRRGHRFKGGNPNDPNAWEQVNGN